MGHDKERLIGSHLIGDEKFRSRLADDDCLIALHVDLKLFGRHVERAVLNEVRSDGEALPHLDCRRPRSESPWSSLPEFRSLQNVSGRLNTSPVLGVNKIIVLPHLAKVDKARLPME
jgi:hypothetical protein